METRVKGTASSSIKEKGTTEEAPEGAATETNQRTVRLSPTKGRVTHSLKRDISNLVTTNTGAQNSQRKEANPFRRVSTTVANDYRHLPVGGRLVRFEKKWRNSLWWTTIRYGLTWNWVNGIKPLPRAASHHWHQRTSPDLDRDVLKMYRKKVIEKTRFLKFRSNLFSVPKRDTTEMRTILDLSFLNEFIANASFKMLTLTHVRLLLPPGAWTVSLDLKDGFWHLSVARTFRPFLGFSYRNQNWRFRAMPFGLNLAPRMFTKLISYVVHCLAQEDIWCLPYLDNLLIIALTKEECLVKLKKSLEII